MNKQQHCRSSHRAVLSDRVLNLVLVDTLPFKISLATLLGSTSSFFHFINDRDVSTWLVYFMNKFHFSLISLLLYNMEHSS